MSIQRDTAGFSGDVHPVAAMFPMMSDEELTDLAEDIRSTGLLQPIVLDAAGMLIDGRNRMEACRRAGVQPTFALLGEEQDAVAFILSSNVARRHLSKGQQAMAVAKCRFETNRSLQQVADSAGLTKARVAYASMVLEFAPDLADAVLLGATPLDAAYEKARNRKMAAEETSQTLERVQAEAPDLATLVVEERMPLNEAVAAVKERKRKEAMQIKTVSMNLDTVLSLLDPMNVPAEEAAAEFLKADASCLVVPSDFSPDRIRRAAMVLMRYAELKEMSAND